MDPSIRSAVQLFIFYVYYGIIFQTHISHFLLGFIRILCVVPLHLLAKYTSNVEYFDLLSGIVRLQECANEQSMAVIRK